MVGWVQKQNPDFPEAAPVHRLDRETSGIQVFGLTGNALRTAGEWFSSGKAKKEYLAVVHGRTRARGRISRPLKTHGSGFTGAETRYRTLGGAGPFSLLLVSPQTGKKHQIRRHLSGIGHPLLGDRRYGPGKSDRNRKLISRLWLHAWKLTLPSWPEIVCPLPFDLEENLCLLGSRYSLPDDSLKNLIQSRI